jgi:hypothetical protein
MALWIRIFPIETKKMPAIDPVCPALTTYTMSPSALSMFQEVQLALQQRWAVLTLLLLVLLPSN